MSKCKKCSVCQMYKPLKEFYNSRRSKDGRGYRCKPCDNNARSKWESENPERSAYVRRNKQLKNKYGIDIPEYNRILKSKGGKCAICETKENTSAYGKNSTSSFAVDHCHLTGKVRGLLCNQCNRGIGMLGDSVEGVERALKYLKETH